jgi:hypothetical protein
MDFSVCDHIQNRTHFASCPLGTGGVFFPGGKWPNHEADHSPSFGVKIKNMWSYTSYARKFFCCLA